MDRRDSFRSRIKTQVKTIARIAALGLTRLILASSALLGLGALPLAAQTPAPASSASEAPAIHSVASVDGPWRFNIGDDPRWADPAFDDSSWRTVQLGRPLNDQGIEEYTGYAWYRFRLQPQVLAPLAAGQSPLLLITGNSVGQLAVYVNGYESAHTRGMTDPPSMYLSQPFAASFLGVSISGPIVIAIRTWAGPDVTVHSGLLGKVELGSQGDLTERVNAAIAQQWNQHVVSALVLTFLFLCVAVFGAALYLAQRNHAEYLWLSLLCVSVAAGGCADAAFGLEWMPLAVYDIFTAFTGHVFMAVTLEFILRFTGSPSRRFVRGVQIAVLLVPFTYFIPLHQVYQVLSTSAEVLFCSLVCVLLFRGWRRKHADAGVMLLPFLLAATADSVDTVLSYAAANHWLPEQFAALRFHLGPVEFGTGTIAYTIFLGSLIAVILYRFVRISAEEQRSEAEISAARSVQALLIPTHLPSNKNFVLESAYLPIHGVGGDFFQVLPLKDDSLLIVVGDVSGKGLQAAMNSSTLVGALRNELSHDPVTVLEHLNRVLIGAVPSAGAVPDLDCAPCYATCLCARIYPDGATTIANAGHLGPYRDGREVPLTPSLPLGVIADAQFEQTTFRLDRGDRLVFISDGVVEATNAHGELFGFERTQQVSNEPARYIAQTAKHFGQNDDITVVSLYVASRAAQHSSEEAVYSN
jgi:hypothetical protein